MSAIWATTAARPAEAAAPIKRSLGRMMSLVRRSASWLESPNRPGNQVATATPNAAALIGLELFQNAAPSRPRSVFESITATLELKTTLPKVVSPKQVASLRSCAMRVAALGDLAGGLIARGAPSGRFTRGSPRRP